MQGSVRIGEYPLFGGVCDVDPPIAPPLWLCGQVQIHYSILMSWMIMRRSYSWVTEYQDGGDGTSDFVLLISKKKKVFWIYLKAAAARYGAKLGFSSPSDKSETSLFT